jgi:hypothetical protein
LNRGFEDAGAAMVGYQYVAPLGLVRPVWAERFVAQRASLLVASPANMLHDRSAFFLFVALSTPWYQCQSILFVLCRFLVDELDNSVNLRTHPFRILIPQMIPIDNSTTLAILRLGLVPKRPILQ